MQLKQDSPSTGSYLHRLRARGASRRAQFDHPLVSALLLLAPTLIGAKGCEIGNIGSDDSSCGGMQGSECSANEFCNFELADSCGAADATGSCEIIPEQCGEIYAPVCGCDDKTYENACRANSAGIAVATEGACEDPGEQPGDDACGGLQGAPCDNDEFCKYELGDLCGAADAQGTCQSLPELCAEIYAPVCGCDDVSYGNACEANAAGISVAAEGACDDPGEQPGDDACGGLQGAPCDNDEFCKYEPGDLCGAADAQGTCQTIPDACTRIYDPVCGCDDTTYGNACEASAAGISVATEGACDDPGEQPEDDACGGLQGAPCDKDEFCQYELGDLCGAADAQGTCQTIPDACIQVFDPVCGCDGTTYGNSCEANAAGVSVATEGACEGSGEQTDDVACGGRQGATCEADEFCNYEIVDICGAADAMGTCMPVPAGCDDNYEPVCGCDGTTFSNECEANSASVAVASEGVCEVISSECSSGDTGSCGEDEFCDLSSSDIACDSPQAIGKCRPRPEICNTSVQLVCGCDGQTYNNDCEANAAGQAVLSEGMCP